MQSFIILIQLSKNKDITSFMNQHSSSNVKIQENDSQSIPCTPNLPLIQVNRSRTWKSSELYLVSAFLYYNSDKFSTESSKKQFKIYKYMSAFVQTRNVNQCRSYTNKLLKSFGSIDKINIYFKESLPQYGQMVLKLKHRNEQIFGKSPLVQNSDSINQIYHSIDKILADTTQQPNLSHLEQEEEKIKLGGIVIPQAKKWQPFLFDNNMIHLNMMCYEPTPEICELFRKKCLEWALGVIS